AVLQVRPNEGAANPADLQILGITAEELTRIAEVYEPGQSLWRVMTSRFSPIDLNWFSDSSGPPPPSPPPSPPPPPDGGQCKAGSIVRVEEQTLGEQIDIIGTPLTLNYS